MGVTHSLGWCQQQMRLLEGGRHAIPPVSAAIQGLSPAVLSSHKSLYTDTNLAQNTLAAMGHTCTRNTKHNHKPRPGTAKTQATTGKSDQNP